MQEFPQSVRVKFLANLSPRKSLSLGSENFYFLYDVCFEYVGDFLYGAESPQKQQQIIKIFNGQFLEKLRKLI